MLDISPQEYQALTRQDFSTFVQRVFAELNPGIPFKDSWHVHVMAQALQACQAGETKRLIINVPPRHLKSLMASVALPAFVLGHNPAARIMCVSYGEELANKLARDRLRALRSVWYQELFPHTRLSSERQAVSEFVTTEQGYCLAVSIGGAITGRGADFIIIDDPLKPEDALSDTQRQKVNEFYANTLYSRLDDKENGCIITIMQRLHQDDLVGHILAQESWKLLSLPAIAEKGETFVIRTLLGTETHARREGDVLHPERESAETLARIRETIGSYNFAGQYQQSPAPRGGGLVKSEWLLRYEPYECPTSFDLILQSWDTATKANQLNSHTACTTWGIKGAHIYLLDVTRKRLDYPDLKREVSALRALFKPDVILIEDKSSGTQLLQELLAEGIHGVQGYKPEVEKVMRMNAQTGTIEGGFVHIPAKAHWLQDYLDEMTTFPRGRFDDQVDSTSQALDWIKQGSWKRLDPVFELYKRQFESQNAPPKPVRLKAPAGVVNVYFAKAFRTVDADGTLEMTAEEAEIQLRNGWTRL